MKVRANLQTIKIAHQWLKKSKYEIAYFEKIQINHLIESLQFWVGRSEKKFYFLFKFGYSSRKHSKYRLLHFTSHLTIVKDFNLESKVLICKNKI